MSRIAWKWLLPALMLALTVGLHLYEPFVYARTAKPATLEGALEVTPTWPGRIELGLSYPALVLTGRFRHWDRPLYARHFGHAYLHLSLSQLAFFAVVVVVWHIAGRKIDRLTRRDRRSPWPRAARIAALLAMGVLGLAVVLHADRRLASQYTSWRQIGLLGLGWGLLLLAGCFWGLVRDYSGRRAWLALLSTGAGAVVATVCWVGGPLCAAQGAGEYLRPSAVRFLPGAHCRADLKAPPELLRQVQAEAHRRRLTLLRLTVCEEPLVRPGHPALDIILRFNLPEPEHWVPAGPQPHVYQYRRYVTVFAPGTVNSQFVFVQADLIQSRWDYLRENWHRVEPAWSWPYTGLKPTGGMW